MIPCGVTEFTDLLEEMDLSNDERLFVFQLLARVRQSDATQSLTKQLDIDLVELFQCLNERVQNSDPGENQ